jgi:hypothetical protein
VDVRLYTTIIEEHYLRRLPHLLYAGCRSGPAQGVREAKIRLSTWSNFKFDFFGFTVERR